MPVSIPIYKELTEVQNRVYNILGLEYSQAIINAESSEYKACSFQLNNLNIKFRVAKITPTKIGQFVTMWKRIEKGPIQPYDSSDSVDYFIINTQDGANFGQFIFSKSILCQQDIFSINNLGGKRAIRVYPPWDITVNHQAQKTQKWQLEYFLEIPSNAEIDINRAKLLYKQAI